MRAPDLDSRIATLLGAGTFVGSLAAPIRELSEIAALRKVGR
jgi:hypothetical protein